MLTIENRTDWRTEDIRAIVDAVAAEELMPRQKKHIRIVVFHKNAKDARGDRYLSARRQGDSQAAARVGLKYNAFHVTLPKLVREPKPDGAIVETARAYLGIQLAHEFAECRGKAHADMRGSTRYGYRVAGRPWGDYWRRTLASRPLRWGKPAPEPKPIPTPEQIADANLRNREKRLAHAERMVALWTRRQKLASTHLAKWKRRLRARQRGLSR
jgi:hypothetical protein